MNSSTNKEHIKMLKAVVVIAVIVIVYKKFFDKSEKMGNLFKKKGSKTIEQLNTKIAKLKKEKEELDTYSTGIRSDLSRTRGELSACERKMSSCLKR
jgi:uncharacterized membrane protein YcaP (DUF421 family)